MFRIVILALMTVWATPYLKDADSIDGARKSLLAEVFDTRKQRVIQRIPVDDYVINEVTTILSEVKLYPKVKLELDGRLVKIPLSPAVKVDNDFFSGFVQEAILYQGRLTSDKENYEQLVILITSSNKMLVCTSSYPFDSFLQKILHSQ